MNSPKPVALLLLARISRLKLPVTIGIVDEIDVVRQLAAAQMVCADIPPTRWTRTGHQQDPATVTGVTQDGRRWLGSAMASRG